MPPGPVLPYRVAVPVRSASCLWALLRAHGELAADPDCLAAMLGSSAADSASGKRHMIPRLPRLYTGASCLRPSCRLAFCAGEAMLLD